MRALRTVVLPFMLGALLALLFAVAIRPAQATTDYAGRYAQLNTPPGPQAFTSGQCITSDDYYPTVGNFGVTFYTNATQAGTIQIFRVDGQGVQHSAGAAVAITANTENWQVVNAPMLPRMRAQYCNTNATGGTVQFEAAESGGRGL